MSSSTPDTAFTQKPSHIALKNGSIVCSGRPRAKPSIRTSIATLAPTRNASPTVCRIRMIGKAQSDPSRIQMLSPVRSIQSVYSNIGVTGTVGILAWWLQDQRSYGGTDVYGQASSGAPFCLGVSLGERRGHCADARREGGVHRNRDREQQHPDRRRHRAHLHLPLVDQRGARDDCGDADE